MAVVERGLLPRIVQRLQRPKPTGLSMDSPARVLSYSKTRVSPVSFLSGSTSSRHLPPQQSTLPAESPVDTSTCSLSRPGIHLTIRPRGRCTRAGDQLSSRPPPSPGFSMVSFPRYQSAGRDLDFWAHTRTYSRDFSLLSKGERTAAEARTPSMPPTVPPSPHHQFGVCSVDGNRSESPSFLCSRFPCLASASLLSVSPFVSRARSAPAAVAPSPASALSPPCAVSLSSSSSCLSFSSFSRPHLNSARVPTRPPVDRRKGGKNDETGCLSRSGQSGQCLLEMPSRVFGLNHGYQVCAHFFLCSARRAFAAAAGGGSAGRSRSSVGLVLGSNAKSLVDIPVRPKPRRFFDLKTFKRFILRYKQKEEEAEDLLLKRTYTKPLPEGWTVLTFLEKINIGENAEDIAAAFSSWTDLANATIDELQSVEGMTNQQRRLIVKHVRLYNHGLWPENSYEDYIDKFQAPPLENENKEWTEADDARLLELAAQYDVSFGDPWLYISWEMQRDFVDVQTRYEQLVTIPKNKERRCEAVLTKCTKPLFFSRYFKLLPSMLYVIPSKAHFNTAPVQPFYLPSQFAAYRRNDCFRQLHPSSSVDPTKNKEEL
ncbi:UNVERIFIED_CONTAM: hypothetical protein HHA_288990 [Hammondia hammondi]|eukprot:XP_008889081.1 hypothetical protein HHA_288990 [Hammondia hammondi]